MRFVPLALCFCLSLAACDSTTPEEAAAGVYRAERFRVTSGSETADILAAGGHFDVTLTDDGRFSAVLSSPDIPGIEGDEAFAASFDGTYALRGADEVVFFHSEDLFVRDLEWSIDDGTIRTSDALDNGDRFDIVLRKE